MKLSLSWIFDHLKSSWKDIDLPAFFIRCSTTIVEIGSYEYKNVDLALFTAVLVRKAEADQIAVFSPEYGKEYALPPRAVQEGQCYLIKVIDSCPEWVLLRDFHSAKEGLLPQISLNDQALAGEWKNTFESEDVIIEIDNVALTHRPDLWSHRGFAREFGALLGCDLVPMNALIAQVPVKPFEYKASASQDHDFTLNIEDRVGCRRLAAVYIPQVEHEGSWLWMAHRLARIDYKPIDAFVDATNYVMADLGQPLHAFDANRLTTRSLKAIRAHGGQALDLLDGTHIELAPDDLIISDGKAPLALAGVMGGVQSGVSVQTEALLVEAASFDPQVIRKTTNRLKIRTEASARFEKNIDPNQNVSALQRFLQILDDNAKVIIDPQVIVSVGPEFKAPTIEISHEFLEKKLGIVLQKEFVVQTLKKIEFGVQIKQEHPLIYTIKVPSFRGTKDVVCAEDIAEEIARFYGLANIPHTVPSLALKPGSVANSFSIDRLKYYFAYGAHMHEMCNYALFDEEFLSSIGWAPEYTVEIKNPVSSLMYRLVTSLVPNLLKNVVANSAAHNAMNFFECNKVFSLRGGRIDEYKSVAGIFYAPAIDFYEKKEYLTTLFEMLRIPVEWRKATAEDELEPWYHPYQTALLMYGSVRLGVAGIAHPYFLHKILPGQAFIFELNADILIDAPRPVIHAQPLAKYQDTWADVSVLVPLAVTAQMLIKALSEAHEYIFQVHLIDFFEKPEWKDQRSLTLRYYARSAHKTLDQADIKDIYDRVLAVLTSLGAVVR